MKSPLKIIILFMIIAVLAYGVWQYSKPKNVQPEYITATATIANIEDSVLATGTLQASRTVNVGAQVSGQVTEMRVKLGDHVKQGDLIARIDSVTQNNNLKTAQANIRNQQAQRESRLIAIEKAQADYNRHATLYKDKATSKAELDSALAALKTAKADLAALDAQIEQSKLSIATAHQNLNYTNITAPISGTVVSIVTEQGQTVNANQTAPTIVKLAQLENMTINASVSEADVMKVEAGQDVYFTTLGSEKKHFAKLRQIEPAPSSSESSSNSAIYYNALFDVPNPDGKLRIDMTAQVTIILNQAQNALTIPASALQKQRIGSGQANSPHSTQDAAQNKKNTPPTPPVEQLELTGEETRAVNDGDAKLYTVRVLQADGVAKPQQVLIGLNNRVTAQVLKGLKQGDKVIIADASDTSNNASKRSNTAPPRM